MKKQTKLLLLLLLALGLLTACKKGEGPLEVYDLGVSAEDNVVALDSILDVGEATLFSIDAPIDSAIAEKLGLSHTYHYREMDDPAELAKRYIAVLMTDEQGFTPIDAENHRLTDEPNTDLLAGSVALGKAAVATAGEEGEAQILRVVVGWSEYAVAVQVAYIPGKLLAPVKKDEPKDNEDKQQQEDAGPTSMSEQLDYFNSIDPRKLGLEGDDMHAYMVFPQQAWVLVDGISCREMGVYLQDVQTATNVYMGTYYLSSDMTRVYEKTSDGSIVQRSLE